MGSVFAGSAPWELGRSSRLGLDSTFCFVQVYASDSECTPRKTARCLRLPITMWWPGALVTWCVAVDVGSVSRGTLETLFEHAVDGKWIKETGRAAAGHIPHEPEGTGKEHETRTLGPQQGFNAKD